jgi:hypothetical protein
MVGAGSELADMRAAMKNRPLIEFSRAGEYQRVEVRVNLRQIGHLLSQRKLILTEQVPRRVGEDTPNITKIVEVTLE